MIFVYGVYSVGGIKFVERATSCAEEPARGLTSFCLSTRFVTPTPRTPPCVSLNFKDPVALSRSFRDEWFTVVSFQSGRPASSCNVELYSSPTYSHTQTHTSCVKLYDLFELPRRSTLTTFYCLAGIYQDIESLLLGWQKGNRVSFFLRERRIFHEKQKLY